MTTAALSWPSTEAEAGLRPHYVSLRERRRRRSREKRRGEEGGTLALFGSYSMHKTPQSKQTECDFTWPKGGASLAVDRVTPLRLGGMTALSTVAHVM